MRAALRLASARALLLAALACALLVRLAVPGGWMPVSTPDGVRLVLCSGVAPAPSPEAVAHHDGHEVAGSHHRPDQPDAPEQPCDFTAAASALAWTAAPAPVSPTVAAASTPASLPHTVAVGRGLAAPPPPSTGPPLLV